MQRQNKAVGAFTYRSNNLFLSKWAVRGQTKLTDIKTHARFNYSSFLFLFSLLHSSVFLFFRVGYCLFSQAVDFFTVL